MEAVPPRRRALGFQDPIRSIVDRTGVCLESMVSWFSWGSLWAADWAIWTALPITLNSGQFKPQFLPSASLRSGLLVNVFEALTNHLQQSRDGTKHGHLYY